jgi:hypothetical protein
MNRTFSKFAIIGAAFAAIVGITVLITGQPASKLSQRPASRRPIGVPEDWSHHHLVFSDPGTYEQAAKSGASYAKWLTIQYDTRFILQQMRRRAEANGGLSRGLSTGGEGVVSPSGVVGPDELTIGLLRGVPGEGHGNPKPTPKPKPTRFSRDWSQPLSAGAVQPNAYPAKWGLSTTTASCSDFVVYPTGVASTSIVVYNNLYQTGCSGTVPSVYGAYYTDGNNSAYYGAYAATVSTSPIVSLDGSQLAFIQSNGNNASSLVLLKLASSGSLGSPATAVPVDRTSYRTCSAPCMTELGWGPPPLDETTYSSTLSAPFYDYSSDAAYVGDDTGRLYKFEGIFGGTPNEPGDGENPNWPLRLTMSNKLTSPVYDSVSGLIFVGDTGGYLYAVGSGNQGKTEGTLYATSAKLGDAIIDAPLVDSTAGTVYVFVTKNTDATTPSNAVFQFNTSFTTGSTGNGSATGTEVGTGSSGYYLYAGDFDNLYYSSSTPGSPSGNLYVVGNTGATSGAVLYQVPILAVANFTDSGNVTSSSPSITSTTKITSADDGMQITDTTNPTCIPPNDTIESVSGSTVTLTTATSASCGTHTGDTLQISNMGARASVATVTGSGDPPWPSPLTEFCNNSGSSCVVTTGGSCGTGVTCTSSGTDYLFFSVNEGAVGGCADSSGNGCVLSYNISMPSSPSLSAYMNITNVGSPGCWASGGLVIDNSVPSGTLAGASQVYFINLNGVPAGGAGGLTNSSCGSAISGNKIQAVQASQSKLNY